MNFLYAYLQNMKNIVIFANKKCPKHIYGEISF